MTLEAYDPQRLDELSLRAMDFCARLRHLARISREESLPPLELHGRKALEWLEKLEDWALKAETQLNHEVTKARGVRAARAAGKKKS